SIVTSSTGAKPPMPFRVATSPSKCVGSTAWATAAGSASWYVPVATPVSGSAAPVSSILISFEPALTTVAMCRRPFFSVSPSYSLATRAAARAELVGRRAALGLGGRGLLGQLDRDGLRGGLERDRPQRLDPLVGTGGQGGGGPLAATVVRADADDPAQGAAV